MFVCGVGCWAWDQRMISFLQDNPCQHPLFFMKDTSYVDIAAVVEFVYKGEVNVLQSQLASFLKTAEMLQVKGLAGDENEAQVGYQTCLEVVSHIISHL